MANYLRVTKRQQVISLQELGWAYRRIERETGVRREAVAGYDRLRQAKAAKVFPASDPAAGPSPEGAGAGSWAQSVSRLHNVAMHPPAPPSEGGWLAPLARRIIEMRRGDCRRVRQRWSNSMSLTVREHLRRRRISILLMLISPLLAASGQQSRVTGPGSPELSKDGFPLATDTIDAYNVSGGERRLAGVYVQRAARRVAPDGRAQFLLITEFQASGGTDIALDTVHIDAAGLRPVSHVVRAAHHAAAIEYLADTVRGWIAVQGRPRQQIDRPLPRPVFPASLLEHVISLLPLEEQYETQVALYDMWSDTKQLTGIRVIESTTIPHQGRMRPAWLVEEIRGDRATRLRWVDKTTGRVLQAHDRPPSAPNPDDGYWRIVR